MPLPTSPQAEPGTFDGAYQRKLVVSLVSHGHGAMVQRLLLQLAHCAPQTVARVVLTQNFPEAEPVAPLSGWPFKLELLRNAEPLGFGQNHNRALLDAREPFVCVLNPDVVLLGDSDPFAAMVRCAALSQVGCAYPGQTGARGENQDNEREWPTPTALLRRWVLRHKETRADWVSAACLVVPLGAWRQLNGFDTKYFMYCEDVDLCLRIRIAGWSLARANATVEHTGQRASHKKWRHFAWHVTALLRLWASPAYRTGRRLHGSSTRGNVTITPS